MQILNRTSGIVILIVVLSAGSNAQQLPPVHPLGPVLARSTEQLGTVTTARALPGGRVLINDVFGHRVLLLDSTFTKLTVVADSTSSTANAYGPRNGGLFAYRGDSTMFVDPASLSMLVIDPAGKIVRVISAPRPADVPFLVGGPNGTPGFDDRGRIVYRGFAKTGPPQAGGPADKGLMSMPSFPDSAPIVRVDLETRKVDTAAFFRINKPNMQIRQLENGGMSATSIVNPIPTIDDWALLSDGTVAVVRGKDYHIDWTTPDGIRSSSAKIPYDWQRLNDSGKVALLDSARTAIEKARATAQAQMTTSTAAGGGTTPPPAGASIGGEMQMVFRMNVDHGGGDGSVRANGPAAGASMQMPPLTMIPANELPDYRPAFTSGSARGDLDGNLWVRTTSPVGNNGPVYYVINRKAEVIDRVQLPAGRLVAGFGSHGMIYLAVRDADGNARLERATIR
jgi:hypothetical protein